MERACVGADSQPAWRDGWIEAQDRLAGLSLRGVRIVAENNGHSLALENPKLVAAAIETVVKAVRGAPFDLTEVRRLASKA